MVDTSTGVHYFSGMRRSHELLDNVPILVGYRRDGIPMVVSRFLDFALVVWLDPILEKGKTIVRFAKGLHDIISDQSSNVFTEELEHLSGRKAVWLYSVYLPFLKKQLTRSYGASTLSGYSDRIVLRKPSSEHIFRVSKCKSIVVVGRTLVQPHTLLEDVNSILISNLRVSDRLILEGLEEILCIISKVNRRQQTLAMSIRKVETEVDGIKQKIDNLDTGISEILNNISVKKVAYGEYEVIFPTPIGAIYKIHVPAGELTTDDVLRISNMVNNAIEKVKQKSSKLYKELETVRHKIAQRILGGLTKL